MTDMLTLLAMRAAIKRAALVAGIDFPTPSLDTAIAKAKETA